METNPDGVPRRTPSARGVRRLLSAVIAVGLFGGLLSASPGALAAVSAPEPTAITTQPDPRDVVAGALAEAIIRDPSVLDQVQEMAGCLAAGGNLSSCAPVNGYPDDRECLLPDGSDAVSCDLPETSPTTTTTTSGTSTTTEPVTTTTEPTTSTTTTEPSTTWPTISSGPITTLPTTTTTTTTWATTPITSTTTTTTTPAPLACEEPRPAPTDVVQSEILHRRRVAQGGKDGCWSLVSSGDSVTSAHNQVESGIPTKNFHCPGTPALTQGIGNDYDFSYANGVFANSRFDGGSYYNFARTGFTTSQLRAIALTGRDACNNEWGKTLHSDDVRNQQGVAPMSLVLQASAFEQAKKRKVAWVTTGGVNNTNWTSVLTNFIACQLLSKVATSPLGSAVATMKIKPTVREERTLKKGEDKLNNDWLNSVLVSGGTCTFSAFGKNVPLTVPGFDLLTVKKGLQGDVSAMVAGAVKAKIDKIVWVGYYDVSLANIDARGLVGGLGFGPEVVASVGQALTLVNIPEVVPIVNTDSQRAFVQRSLDQLDEAICDAVKTGANGAGDVSCLDWKAAKFNQVTDIQTTAPGGSPHPSSQGHGKLATAVINVLP